MSDVSEKDEELQIAVSVTCQDGDVLDVYNVLKFSDEAYKKKLDKTLELMENHAGELNVMCEGYRFF